MLDSRRIEFNILMTLILNENVIFFSTVRREIDSILGNENYFAEKEGKKISIQN